MTAPTLSVCIPTYNRATLLDELLSSLAPQLDDRVEIVVSDNASSDDTADVMARWAARLPKLRYKRWGENRGADRNYLDVVAMAEGQYCWLMGSDDIVAPGALQKIFAAIGENPDCLLYSRLLCSREMIPIEPHTYWTFAVPRRFDFSAQPLVDYLRECRSIAGLFSYLSGIVFRREIWDRDPQKERLIGSAYAHADILIRQLARGASLRASPEITVHCRCGNDSFSDGNKGKRLSLDFDGYARIAAELPPATGLELMRVLIREHPWRNLIHILRYQRSQGTDRGNDFVSLLERLGVPAMRRTFYLHCSRQPWFGVFEALEPWFKKETPWRKLKRRLGLVQ